MQLAKLLPLFLLALPTQASISSETNGVIDATKNLGITITSWSGSASTFFQIVKESSALLTLTNAAALTTKASDPLGIVEATQLAGSTRNVDADTRATLNSFVAAKDKFDLVKVKEQVVAILKAQQVAAKALADALEAKTPALLQGMAQQTSASISSAFTEAIAAVSK